nr:aminotransferase class V-fold PLP-dependent enzyme [Fournierella sp.]
MHTYPLQAISTEEAMALQFKVVDSITREFAGHEILTRGDLGVVPGLNKPVTTKKAETVIARVFDAEAAMLVRGAGTDAIADALFSVIRSGETLLVHTSPVYSTTQTTLTRQGINTVAADFNDLEEIRRVMQQHPEIRAALVQYTRQSMQDSYDMEQVIRTIKSCRPIPVVTDDNYAVMKVSKIGTQCGADLSCFSTFKLLGPEGVGCIVGKKCYIEELVRYNYSGGSQVQGHEALDVLRGLTYAPVALSIQARVNDRLVERLLAGELPGIKDAFLANAQSKVLLVEFEEPIAEQVLAEAEKLGAAPNPIGAESRYELVPMFYRVSGTFRAMDPTITSRMIRINPMRSGDDTVIRILKEAMKRVR